ncbi:uncharacterized protein BJ171DRAFT_1465 [Polychytrium aggregatum]|uniref:uncharacterized protein n=1 Tax=Polychytrium aggregatum TaxID=110093 RepID=UPI0022FF3843|nr:uncharacterized protein BJ171DRAFT_1465 [Polychytrium aggregatum]KAI9209538.1 hypothetical protein BJ171DRAFT_1465 [Polychytrium aggregatum]
MGQKLTRQLEESSQGGPQPWFTKEQIMDVVQILTRINAAKADLTDKYLSRATLETLFKMCKFNDSQQRFLLSIFATFDSQRSQKVDSRKIVVGMSAFCTIKINDRLAFAFEAYELMSEGLTEEESVLTKDVIETVILCLIETIYSAESVQGDKTAAAPTPSPKPAPKAKCITPEDRQALRKWINDVFMEA